jgi:hypothetical protein
MERSYSAWTMAGMNLLDKIDTRKTSNQRIFQVNKAVGRGRPDSNSHFGNLPVCMHHRQGGHNEYQAKEQ